MSSARFACGVSAGCADVRMGGGQACGARARRFDALWLHRGFGVGVEAHQLHTAVDEPAVLHEPHKELALAAPHVHERGAAPLPHESRHEGESRIVVPAGPRAAGQHGSLLGWWLDHVHARVQHAPARHACAQKGRQRCRRRGGAVAGTRGAAGARRCAEVRQAQGTWGA